jgi:hypothetical protein
MSYNVLVDEEAANKVWEDADNKKRWNAHVRAKYTKTGVKTILKSVVNHFTFSVAGAIFDAPAAISTSTHIKRLGEIQQKTTTYGCNCSGVGTKCHAILKYIIEQKEKKQSRCVLGAIPVIGTVESLRGVYKSLTKTNKGSPERAVRKSLAK